MALLWPFAFSDTVISSVRTFLEISLEKACRSQTSASFFFESKMYIFCASTSKIVVRVVPPMVVSVRIFIPLMYVTEVASPDCPNPLPFTLCLTVTSACAHGATPAAKIARNSVRCIRSCLLERHYVSASRRWQIRQAAPILQNVERRFPSLGRRARVALAFCRGREHSAVEAMHR